MALRPTSGLTLEARKSMPRRYLRAAPLMTAVRGQALPTFEQGARKAWAFGSTQYKRVRDAVKYNGGGMYDDRWKLDDRTECYSGTDEYAVRAVFCDAECLSENKDDPACAGPWYCARTKVCEAFHNPHGRQKVDPTSRKCAVVHSCANHSQCYPTPPDQKAMGVSTASSDLSNLDDAPFKYKLAGFTMETTCCTNRGSFKHDLDVPCNGGSAVAVSVLVSVVALAVGS